MEVAIKRDVYTSYPAVPGFWSMRIERELIAVPRQGDWIELAEGWASEMVKDVTFMTDGSVLVELKPIKIDNQEVFEEHYNLVDRHGWRWTGRWPDR